MQLKRNRHIPFIMKHDILVVHAWLIFTVQTVPTEPAPISPLLFRSAFTVICHRDLLSCFNGVLSYNVAWYCYYLWQLRARVGNVSACGLQVMYTRNSAFFNWLHMQKLYSQDTTARNNSDASVKHLQ